MKNSPIGFVCLEARHNFDRSLPGEVFKIAVEMVDDDSQWGQSYMIPEFEDRNYYLSQHEVEEAFKEKNKYICVDFIEFVAE